MPTRSLYFLSNKTSHSRTRKYVFQLKSSCHVIGQRTSSSNLMNSIFNELKKYKTAGEEKSQKTDLFAYNVFQSILLD